MRRWTIPCIICAALLAAAVLIGASARERPLQPTLELSDAARRDGGIADTADWRHQRIHEGIGWRLGTVSRGDGSVMKGGYTVVHPAKGKPFSLSHCYVLAAFDLLPSEILLVAVRDPEIYWIDYDYREGVSNPVELVWYTQLWEESAALLLDFAPNHYPDGFMLAPDQLSLLAIRHTTDDDGDLVQQGHELCQVRLRDGGITDVPLPGVSAHAPPPAAWWPVLIDWDNEALLAQLGDELRRYEVHWE